MSTIRGPERVTDSATLDAIYSLRAVVWSSEAAEQVQSRTQWRDEFDSIGLHWAAWLNGDLIGAARLTIHDSLQEVPDSSYFLSQNITLVGRVASLNRLVVSPIGSGFGLSRAFDELRLKVAQDAGAKFAVGYAFERRAKIARRAGFEIVGRCNADIPFMGPREICILVKTFT